MREIYSREELIPSQPEDWQEIVGRLPKLPGDSPLNHVQIAYQGGLISFNEAISDKHNWTPMARIVFSTEILGAPKAGKTTLIKYLEYELDRLSVGNKTHFERVTEVDRTFDPDIFNLAMQLSAASSLVENIALARTWVEHQRKRLIFYDRGVFSPLPFAKTHKEFKGYPGIDYRISESVAKVLAYAIDAVVIVNISPEESKKRGSKMTLDYLRDLHKSHKELPKILTELTAEISHPLYIVEIDASEDAGTVSAFTFQTLGTLLEASVSRRSEWEDLESDLHLLE